MKTNDKNKVNDSFKIEINNRIYTVNANELQNIQHKGIEYKYVID